MPQVVEFFGEHYGPRNLTIALVGDVTTEQVCLRRFGWPIGLTVCSSSLNPGPSVLGAVANMLAFVC
jgi:hypothetical protein